MSLKNRSRICRRKSSSSMTAPRNSHSSPRQTREGFLLRCVATAALESRSCSPPINRMDPPHLGRRQRLPMICSRNKNNPRPNRDAHAQMKSTTIADIAARPSEWGFLAEAPQWRQNSKATFRHSFYDSPLGGPNGSGAAARRGHF